MQIGSEITDRNSEEVFASEMQILLDAGAGVIHVRAGEMFRAACASRKTLLADGCLYKEWNVVDGFRVFDLSNFTSSDVTGDGVIDLATALHTPVSTLSEGEEENTVKVFVYIAPHHWLEHNNPTLIHHLMVAAQVLPSTNTRIVLITPDVSLPDSVSDLVASVRFNSPGYKELREYLDDILGSVPSEDINKFSKIDKNQICGLGAGMSKGAFELYVSKAISGVPVDKEKKVSASDISRGVNDGKTEVVNSNDLLELYPTESMSDIGGMANLKEWIRKRADCFSDKAKAFGVEPPKGLVLTGVSGNGKSMIAKAIAKEFGVPLIRLDFGRVFNSLVGKSEERMRTALKMLEECSPNICLIDEIDKSLGGAGGAGDSGTSSRVLGTFLSWMQDNKYPVFVVASANNIDALPPELLRRGRFDAIFNVGLPQDSERADILKIHLRKRGYEDAFNKAEIRSVVNASKGYVAAEIESAVKDGLVDAFGTKEKFSVDHVLNALESMVPLSKSFAEQIQKMTLWAKNNAISASELPPKKQLNSNVAPITRRRNVRTKTPTTKH